MSANAAAAPIVVIIDDTPGTLRDMTALLRSRGFDARPAVDATTALQLLPADGAVPSFVLLDHFIRGHETNGLRYLEALRKDRPRAFVVMYTAAGRIEEARRWQAMRAGAHRYIRKGNATDLLADIDQFVHDMTDLLALTREFELLSAARPGYAFEIVGLNLPLAVIDPEYRIWIANRAQEELVGLVPATGAPCWNTLHGYPVSNGPCLRCPVLQVLAAGVQATEIYLARKRDGTLAWLEADAVPLLARDSQAPARIMAVKKTTQPLGPRIHQLARSETLRLIAQGIVRDGYGRARIYDLSPPETLRCVAAAAGPDVPDDDAYHAKAVGFSTTIGANEAALIANADQRPRVFEGGTRHAATTAFHLDLEPPWLDYPILHDDKLIGWLGVDLIGGTRAGLSEEDFAVLEPFAAEVREALLRIPQATSRNLLAQAAPARARGLVGVKEEPLESLRLILATAVALVPRSFAWVRSHENGRLLLLAQSGDPLHQPEASVAEGDRDSRAAVVLSSRQPLFIADLADFDKRRSDIPTLPAGRSQGPRRGAIAVLPLIVEWTCFGTLAVETPEPLDWEAEGLKTALLEFASLAGLVVRDIQRTRHFADAKLAHQMADIAFGTVHDFKGPTQALRNYLGSLQSLNEQDRLTPGKVTELSTKASHCLLRIERMGDRLLRFVNTSSPASDTVPLRIMVSECEAESRILYPDLELSVSVPDDIDNAPGVASELRFVLDELVTNAATATEQVGKVAIRCETEGDFLSLTVEDDGCGIAPSEVDHIFDRWITFFPGGTGLGLAFVKSAITRMNGLVSAQSLPRGFRITVLLPVATVPAP